MTNPIIETDLAKFLNKLDDKLDNLDRKFEQKFDKLDTRLNKIDDRLNNLEVGQSELKGEIKTLDERLSGEIKTLDKKLSGEIKVLDEKLSGEIKTLGATVKKMDKRLANQEFTNRGVLVGLILVMLGGLVKLFELWNF